MRSAMIWQNSLDNSGQVLIEPSVIDLVLGHRQHKSNMPESGGILLGYRRGKHIHIVDATTPQPDDQRSRFHFFRCAPHHQSFATSQWDMSDNTMDYIGEWHTHPELEPTPSSLDISEWKKICCSQKANMVFLIAGWTGAFWLGVGRGQRIVKSTEVTIE